MSDVKFTPVPFQKQENWTIQESGWYILVENRPVEGPYGPTIDTRDLTSYFNYKYDNSKSAQLLFMTRTIRPQNLVRKANKEECMNLVHMMFSGWTMAQDLSGKYQLVPDFGVAKLWPNSLKNFKNPSSKETIQLEIDDKILELPANWQALALSDLKTW